MSVMAVVDVAVVFETAFILSVAFVLLFFSELHAEKTVQISIKESIIAAVF